MNQRRVWWRDCLPAKGGFETTHITLRSYLEDFLLFFRHSCMGMLIKCYVMLLFNGGLTQTKQTTALSQY